MNYMRKPIITPPDTLFALEQSTFDELHDVVSSLPHKNYSTLHIVGYEHDLAYPAAKLITILGEVTEKLLKYGERVKGIHPDSINYTIEASDVAPGRAQRGPGWHYDGSVNQPILSMVAADKIPTEFITASDPQADVQRLTDQYLYRVAPDSNGFQSKPIQDGINDGALQIYRPQEYDMVVMTDHVHQSSQNNTAVPIPRTWIRGALHFPRNDY